MEDADGALDNFEWHNQLSTYGQGQWWGGFLLEESHDNSISSINQYYMVCSYGGLDRFAATTEG